MADKVRRGAITALMLALHIVSGVLGLVLVGWMLVVYGALLAGAPAFARSLQPLPPWYVFVAIGIVHLGSRQLFLALTRRDERRAERA